MLFAAIAHKAKTTATAGLTVLDNNLWYHYQTEIRNGEATRSYCFLDRTKLFEFLLQKIVVGGPCKATAIASDSYTRRHEGLIYPMNNFDMIE